MSHSSPNEVYDWAKDPGAFAADTGESRRRRQSEARRARDGAIYTRQQKGHSLFMWLLVWGPVTLWIPTLYFHFSPNHFWKV